LHLPGEFSNARDEQIWRDVNVSNARRVIATEIGDAVGGKHLIVDEKITSHVPCIGRKD